LRFGLNHGGDDHGAIGPRALDLGDLPEIDFKRTVGDELNVIDGQHALTAIVPRAIAIGDIEHRRANGLPHGSAPACFKGAMDLRAGVGGRSRGEPEGIGGLDAGEVDAQVCHG